AGDAREALRLYQELLPDQERVLGPDHPNVLITRNNIAGWTEETRNAREALRSSQELLLQFYRELAQNNPETYLPDVATTLKNLGVLDRGQGRMEEARKEYAEALQ